MKSAESRVDGLHNFRRVVPSATITSRKKATVVPEAMSIVEKEAVKSVLILFLRKQGLTNAAATRTISKSDRFINHLVSRLHTIDKTRYLVGSELPILALEIRDRLVPYLESLLEEHGDILVDVVENFPDLPDNKGTIYLSSPAKLPLDSKKLEVMGPVSDLGHNGKFPPYTLYLLEIGFDLEQIKEIERKCPPFVNYSLEERIKPAVEFLLDLGMPQSDIPSFICNAPYCCGTNLSDTIIPTLLFLENQLGVDKESWLKILKRYPVMFKTERWKVKRTVDFLYEIGFSKNNIAEVITATPLIVSYSLDNKLRPIAEYFHSLGVNVPNLLSRFPRLFELTPEKINQVTDFFMDKGYSMEEIRTIAMKHGSIYLLKVKSNLKPKWDFFITMNCPRSMLVKFPRYFNYSLEGRIKPRYKQMMERGLKLDLCQMLHPTDTAFEKLLNKRPDLGNQ